MALAPPSWVLPKSWFSTPCRFAAWALRRRYMKKVSCEPGLESICWMIPATMSLGTFTFAMDALPGSPQIQNIIPTTFFGTTTMAAPILGPIGGLFILLVGMLYLDWRRRAAAEAAEGYGAGHLAARCSIEREASSR